MTESAQLHVTVALAAAGGALGMHLVWAVVAHHRSRNGTRQWMRLSEGGQEWAECSYCNARATAHDEEGDPACSEHAEEVPCGVILAPLSRAPKERK